MKADQGFSIFSVFAANQVYFELLGLRTEYPVQFQE